MSDKPNGNDFTCQWDCSFCPSEPGQPKSYLSDEPGVQRGKRNKFDPITQFNERASTHFINGHTVDKIELLILGGTFHSYPIDYRKDFITKLLYAANTFFDTDKRDVSTLDNEVLLNETTLVKIIGITIETRPDCINKETLRELRELEVTRIQMGLQHTSDSVLKRNNRGHLLKHTIRGIQLAMNNGFKIDIHIMPNMPGSSLKMDSDMFDLILNAPYLQCDQWKIYPTQVTPYTKIEEEYRNGTYIPYSSADMFELLLDVKVNIPRWIRNNRIVRDFPKQYDIAGNISTNMRQDLHKELEKRGERCKCIRCMEVRNRTISIHNAKLVVRNIENELELNNKMNYKLDKINKNHNKLLNQYNSKNYFISFESCSCKTKNNSSMIGQFREKYITLDKCINYFEYKFQNNSYIGNKEWSGCEENDTLYGFLRLRIIDNNEDSAFIEFKENIAFVRELHVYGTVQKVGNKNKNTVQHYGF
jgi:ELP3 family radical SAM enzyme/protein acetyltransferase